MFQKRERNLWQIVLTAIVVVLVFFFFRRTGDLEIPAQDQAFLLDWARQQLVATASGEGEIAVPFADLTDALQRDGSAFVSLYIDERLRGCMIDEFSPHEPLYRNVLRNTQLAAVSDDRFPPVSAEEINDIRIVISIIGEPEQVTFDNPDDLVDALTPGLDGVILTIGDGVSAYLPYVWETFPDPAEFLSQLCLKQGLDAGRWRESPYPKVEVFRAFSFGETIRESTED